MMVLGFLVLFLFVGVVVALLLGGGGSLLRQMSGTLSSDEQRQPTARQVLDERLARGEIGREEYEEIRAQLER